MAAQKQMLIMVAGPYTSGGADVSQRAKNLQLMNEAALAVWDKGHVPLIGVNAVKPIIEVAGAHRFEEMMMPMCKVLAERCDAVLRVGGPSKGADEEVERVAAKGGHVYRLLAEIPSIK